MVDTLLNVSEEYQVLRKENPIACGEWLLRFTERGLSQAQIARKLGANRQVIGRYIRMALWPTDFKELISRYRNKISNTDIYRAASSPKNEQLLKKSIERKEDNKKTIHPKDIAAEPPTLSVIHEHPPQGNDEGLISDNVSGVSGSKKECITQEAINDVSDSAKGIGEKILRESFCPHEPAYPTPGMGIPPPPALPPQNQSEDDISKSWLKIARYISQPSVAFLILSITALSGYLIHQGILFFSTVDNNNVSAISSAVVSELLPLVCAACFALSVSRMRRFLSGLLLTGSIIGLSLFMHAALSQKQADTSTNVIHLQKQRDSILLSIDNLNESISALPSNFVSKKQDIIRQVDAKQLSLAQLDARIAQATKKATSAGNVLLSYGVWLRIAAMILNAILAHALFIGFKCKELKH